MSYQIEVVSPVSPHNRPVNATAASVSAKLPLAANDTNNITVIPFNEKTDEFPDLTPAMLVIPPKSQCKYWCIIFIASKPVPMMICFTLAEKINSGRFSVDLLVNGFFSYVPISQNF